MGEMLSVGVEAKLCCCCCCYAIARNKKVAVWWNRNRNRNRNRNLNWKKHLAEELIVSARQRKAKWWQQPCNNNYFLSSTTAMAQRGGGGIHVVASVLLLIVILYGAVANAATLEQNLDDTLSNVPQTLSGEDCKKARIQRPKSRDAERCTVKCVTTCIQGGAGSPGEGPLNARSSMNAGLSWFSKKDFIVASTVWWNARIYVT